MSSTLVFNPNTYAGKAAGTYLSAALLGAASLQKGYLKVVPNIKKKRVLRTLEQEVVFQDASCNFNADGNTTFGERYLAPVEMSVMYELCFKDLHQSWEADMLTGGSGKEQVPTDLAQFLIRRMQDKIAIGIEKLIWQGKVSADFTFTAAFPGLLALMEADAEVAKQKTSIGELAISGISIANPGVVTVASTATLKTGDKVTIVGANAATLVGGVAISGQSFSITVLSDTTFSLGVATTGTATGAAGKVQFVNQSNVIAVLSSLFNNVPDAVKHSPDFKIFVPTHIADAYRLAQAAVANGNGTYFSTDKPLNFLGFPLVELPWFNTNTLVATHGNNLFFGTDLLADFNTLQIVDMRATTADQKVRYRANFSADVNYGFGREVVLYRPA